MAKKVVKTKRTKNANYTDDIHADTVYNEAEGFKRLYIYIHPYQRVL